jgi:hypothetical protein
MNDSLIWEYLKLLAVYMEPGRIVPDGFCQPQASLQNTDEDIAPKSAIDGTFLCQSIHSTTPALFKPSDNNNSNGVVIFTGNGHRGRL